MNIGRNVFYGVVAAGLLATGVSAQGGVSGSLPVSEEFVTGGWDWSSGRKGPRYRAHLIAKDGTMHLCGALALGRVNAARVHERRSFCEAVLLFDGKPVMSDLSFFTEVRTEKQLDGATAQCRNVGVPVPKTLQWRIETGSVRYRD